MAYVLEKNLMRDFPLQSLSPWLQKWFTGYVFITFILKRNLISLASIRSYLFLATCQAKQSQEKKHLGEAELGVYQLNNNEKNNIVSTF